MSAPAGSPTAAHRSALPTAAGRSSGRRSTGRSSFARVSGRWAARFLAEPQPLADFPSFGPFAGMPKPTNVLQTAGAGRADAGPCRANLGNHRRHAAGDRSRQPWPHRPLPCQRQATWSDLPISGDSRDAAPLCKCSVPAASRRQVRPTAEALPFRLLTAKGT